jgi:DNA polymerase elongation subunit (family B)
MPYVCANPDCGCVFGEATVIENRLTCPKCKGNKVIAPNKKSIEAIDKTLMPYRFIQRPVDPTPIPYYKISTFVDQSLGRDIMVIHKPKDNGEGTELLISYPPFKPYYYIDEESYKQHTNQIDRLLAEFGGVIQQCNAFGTDGKKVLKVVFSNDMARKSSSYRMPNFARTYQSNRPLTNAILQDYNLTTKALPTRLYMDMEVDPRNVPTLERSDGRILTICTVDNRQTSKSYLLEHDDDDSLRELLRSFLSDIFNYSCVCGFYSAKFDIPYSAIWIMRLGIGFDWDFITTMDMHNIYTVLNTVNYDERKFNLESIAQREFGEGKEELKDYQVIWDWWKSKDERLLKYCMKDADLVRRLDEKWLAIDSRLAATNLTGVRPDSYVSYLHGLESIVIKKLNSRKPPHVLYTPTRKRFEAKIEGALVFDPIIGLHRNVVFLDAKSMYNRIIRTFNIGFDTVDPNGEIITPKARYTNKFDSVLREVLKELEYWRELYRKERDTYELYSEKWIEFDKKQWVVKYYLVSTYGILASPWSFIYDPVVAETITLLGKEVLKVARSIIEYNGFQVVYGDTDSLCFSIPDSNGWEAMLEKAKELAKKVAFGVNYYAKSRFNVNNPEIEFEVDKIFDWAYFTRAKKRYAGLLTWKGTALNPPRLYIAGFESRRTDWPEFVQEIQRSVFMMIGEGKSTQEILSFVREKLDLLYAGRFNDKIIQKKVIRKKISDYTKNIPPYVKAASMLAAQGKEIRIAQQIQYYLAQDKSIIPVVDRPLEVIEPKYYDYIKQQVFSILERMEIPIAQIDNRDLLQVFS